MIHSISVRRRTQYVTYMPREYVSLIPDGETVVSIASSERSRPVFKPSQIVLRVDDDQAWLDVDQCQHVFDWIDANPGKSLNIHCDFGQQRSRWLAELIQSRYPEFNLLRWAPGGIVYNEGTKEF